MKLNELADRPGSRKKRDARRPRHRLGDGQDRRPRRQGPDGPQRRPASRGFEGGQMPLHRRLPKRGFNNLSTRDYNEVGLDRIQQAIATLAMIRSSLPFARRMRTFSRSMAVGT